MMNGLDLFSGIGGLTLALKDWVKPVAYCENEPYAQSVLLSRMYSAELPRAPIWDDITSLKWSLFPRVDIIYGGFPCQDISCAGIGAGLDGKRSSLFYEVIRILGESKATWCFLENVPAIRTRGLSNIIRAFSELGYDCRWTCVSAAEIGAPHIRKRWFLLAHTNSAKLREQSRGSSRKSGEGSGQLGNNGATKSLANSDSGRFEESNTKIRDVQIVDPSSWWSTEPDVDRVVDELPYRVDRIRGLGNAVVPIQAKEAFKRLLNLN